MIIHQPFTDERVNIAGMLRDENKIYAPMPMRRHFRDMIGRRPGAPCGKHSLRLIDNHNCPVWHILPKPAIDFSMRDCQSPNTIDKQRTCVIFPALCDQMRDRP
jgi:hypothetical protein